MIHYAKGVAHAALGNEHDTAFAHLRAAIALEDGHLSKKSAVGGDGMRSIASGIVPAAEAEQILFREAALPVPRHARVQQAGMAHGRRQVAKRRFQHFARLGGAGARRGFAGARVPHLPGRAIEDRLDEDGAYIEVVWIRPVRQAHGIGKMVAGRQSGRAGDSGTAAPRSALVPVS